jgi:tetratricopeptide (TPR) repeat protein
LATQSQFPFQYLARIFVLCLVASPAAMAQHSAAQNPQGGSPLAQNTITVKVVSPDGTPFEGTAVVSLFTFGGSSAGVGTHRSGDVQFPNLAAGRYAVEVVAPGYKKVSETVELSFQGQTQYVYLTLVPDSPDTANTPVSTAPVLAPNAQKDLNKAFEGIRQERPEEARKYLEKLSRSAPGNPDVNFLWGVYWSTKNDQVQAKSYWEKAIQIYPRHAYSLSALAQIAVHDGDLAPAIGYLLKAVEAEPSSWRFEEQLANAYLLHKEYEKAQSHAERAIQLGKDRAIRAQIILVQALIERDDKAHAVKILQSLLDSRPSDLQAASGPSIDTLLKAESSSPTALPVTPAPPSASAVSIAADLTPPPKWIPTDVDENMPAVEPGVACPLPQVQAEAAKRVHDFIESVNKITATEKLDNELLNRSGLPSQRESRSFNYVVGIQEVSKGIWDVEEFRNGAIDPEMFPQHIATNGLPSLVLIFHPDYKDDFEVTCEGLSTWGGGLAWQVHFRQRPDKPSRLRGYNLGGRTTPVSLRGRAWIAADTFQVIRLETDMVSPLPQIRLKAEHIAVDYGPVAFRKYNAKLWLPQTAEVYFDFNGRRIHRRHRFSDYLLFAVDEKERISDPKIPVDADPSATSSPGNF